MSAAGRHRTSWLGQNYEKLILVVILVGLLLSAFLLFMEIGQKRHELAVAAWEKMTIEPKKVEPLAGAAPRQAASWLTSARACVSPMPRIDLTG